MRATHSVSTREKRDDDSDSVRHGQVSAMLLNEFLKEHQAVQEVKKSCSSVPRAQRKCAELRRFAAKISQTVESVSAIDSNGRTIWADAHRGDGKRFVVHAEEKLTAFVELESAVKPFSASSFL